MSGLGYRTPSKTNATIPKPPGRRKKSRSWEPQTPEGRARKKVQIGLLHRMGCVLTYAEMVEVTKVLPPKWLEQECK